MRVSRPAIANQLILQELETEVARLREALKEYAAIEGPPYHGTPFLARAALSIGEK
jgi:hypothetical protein